MERFVVLSVVGGLVLLAGLWTIELADPGTALWGLGLVLVAAGVLGFAAAVGQELDVEW